MPSFSNALTSDASVYLAGGFGNYIKIESAIRIGLMPEELEGKIVRKEIDPKDLIRLRAEVMVKLAPVVAYKIVDLHRILTTCVAAIMGDKDSPLFVKP